MKTLDQVEPRIPVSDANTLGNDTDHFVIAAAGSYYLTGNIAVSKTNGIHVTASGVTLDLNGFRISRSASNIGAGVLIDGAANRCTVKNGTLISFAYGVQATTQGGTLSELAVSLTATSGLSVGDGWRVENCTSHGNSGRGIATGNGCVMNNCLAYGNGGVGIVTALNCALTNCTASGNLRNRNRSGNGNAC
ncbi:MAG: hypothetical protein ACJ8JD_08520 [Chthoniobacterales bacterium]